MSSQEGKETRQDIVTAARRLFVQNGYVATSMDDVGAAIGVSKPFVYAAFESKQRLLEAVFESAMLDMRANLEVMASSAESQVPFGEFVDRFFAEILNVAQSPERFSVFRLLIVEGPRAAQLVDTYVAKVKAPLSQAWRLYYLAAMERGECRPMDPDVIHALLVGPSMHVALDRVLYKEAALSNEAVVAYLEENRIALKARLVLGPGDPDMQAK